MVSRDERRRRRRRRERERERAAGKFKKEDARIARRRRCGAPARGEWLRGPLGRREDSPAPALPSDALRAQCACAAQRPARTAAESPDSRSRGGARRESQIRLPIRERETTPLPRSDDNCKKKSSPNAPRESPSRESLRGRESALARETRPSCCWYARESANRATLAGSRSRDRFLPPVRRSRRGTLNKLRIFLRSFDDWAKFEISL